MSELCRYPDVAYAPGLGCTLTIGKCLLDSALMVSTLLSWYALSACPPTISDHLRLCLPTLWCHSNAHCISLHNHATPVAGLNLDQCLISLDLVPMSQAAAYLSFSPYAAFA